MTIAEKLKQAGRVEGILEGKHEEARKIARSMLAEGFDRATVKQLTGLSEEDLAKISH